MHKIKVLQQEKNKELEITDTFNIGETVAIVNGHEDTLQTVIRDVTDKEKERKNLQEIVNQNDDLERQRLETVRNKTKLLSKLINQEELDVESTRENLAITREIEKIFKSNK